MDKEFVETDFTFSELELLRAMFSSMYVIVRNLDSNECSYTKEDLDRLRKTLGVSKITDNYCGG